MKITIELTELQARHIVKACDLYVRCNLGQFATLQDHVGDMLEHVDREKMLDIEMELKELFWPKQLLPNQSWGIGEARVSGVAKMVYEIGRTIAHKLFKHHNPAGGAWCVDYDMPLNYSGEKPPKVEVIDE